jgi:hypothetical protein
MPELVWREAGAVQPGWWMQPDEGQDWIEVESVSIPSRRDDVLVRFVGGDYAFLRPDVLIRTRTSREMARAS